MSIWPKPGYGIPITTQRVAKAAFPNGSVAIRVRDSLGELFQDKDFTDLYAKRGRPGYSPARLALVSVLQFVEGLTDRQAADAVRGRLDWKYALGLDLTDPGFDASVLTEFRARLVADNQAQRILNLILDQARTHGLLGKGGRQRTDATHVHAAARQLNRLEQVTETMRAALEAIAVAAPSWLASQIHPEWHDRYGRRSLDFRLPHGDKARTDYAAFVGEDGYLLLEALYGVHAPAWVAQIEAVQTLRLTWIQQYYRQDNSIRLRTKDDGSPPAAQAILNPYDTNARYGVKRGMGWSGYKGHFTETCEPGRPHLIIHTATTNAAVADVDTVASRHADLAAADLLPDEHLVDAGYVSIDGILTARDDYGIELIGPLPPNSGWQARDATAFDLTQFSIDWQAKQVTCPNGKISRTWRQGHSREGLPIIQVTFRQPDCDTCPDRPRCTRSTTGGRGLTFRPKRQLETQHQIRAEQATQQWQDRYALRSGAESTMAQASRRANVHQARYRGHAKTHLQHVLTAAAINIIRLDAWLSGTTTTTTWTSRLTRLSQALSPV